MRPGEAWRCGLAPCAAWQKALRGKRRVSNRPLPAMPTGAILRGQHCRRPVGRRAAFFFQRPRPAGSNPRARYFFLESFAYSDPFFEPFHLHERQPLASLRHRRLEVSPTRCGVERRLRHAAEFGKLRDCVVRLRLPFHLRPPSVPMPPPVGARPVAVCTRPCGAGGSRESASGWAPTGGGNNYRFNYRLWRKKFRLR